MKSYFYALAGCLILSLCYNKAAAQGCVAVRQMGGVNPLSSNGYTLPKGEFQIGAGYRYFHSWRHYVGTEEQHERQATGGGHDANGSLLLPPAKAFKSCSYFLSGLCELWNGCLFFCCFAYRSLPWSTKRHFAAMFERDDGPH